MFQRILVIFENHGINQQAGVYARELARRMNAQTVLLTLLDKALLSQGQDSQRHGGSEHGDPGLPQALAKLAAEFQEDGLAVNTALLVGDPAQGLRKFLEQEPPFQALIWGSGSEPPQRGQGRRRHWLKRLAHCLPCPVLTVSDNQRTGRNVSLPALSSIRDQGESHGHRNHFQRDGGRAAAARRKLGQKARLRSGQPRATG